MKITVLFLLILLWAVGPSYSADPANPAQPATSANPAPGAPSTPPTGAKVQNVTPDQAEQLLKSNKNIVVLDVRSAAEFQGGHIPGAQNLDFFAPDFREKLAALDRSKTYLVHCAAGNRSSKACSAMEQQANFGDVYHMKEGFKAWQAAGKPVEK
jgi:phage shock protein E